MASKNLVLKDATWNGVESVDFPVSGGGTARYIETSDATAVAADIAQNKTAYVNGSLITGTATPTVPNIQALSVTENGTYTASGDVDGYSPVTVNVSGGGGGSSYSLIASGEITANTSSTIAVSLTSKVQAGSSAWTSDKIVYVKVRDKAGKRNGYHYGNDCYVVNHYEYRSSQIATTSVGNLVYAYSSTVGVTSYGPIAYGVCVNSISPDGEIEFTGRYNSSYTKTINGTYTVDVYLLDWPDSESPFTS